MGNAAPTTARLDALVRRYNRTLALDALLKASLGFAFSLLIFGVAYWFAWVVGIGLARYLGLAAWQFAAIVSGVFAAVATWSAWRRVDPLAGLQPVTEQQLMVIVLDPASADILCFSPRHAIAGVAVLLIGGPANVFQALGLWTSRLPCDPATIAEASRLLVACDPQCPSQDVLKASAALLLRRLALIKVVSSGDSAAFALTDKGYGLLARRGNRTAKPPHNDTAALKRKPR